uniref:anterior gradient protein 2 homolog n=1 Tax=Myxine glutinosa TaxID=7769 RepID=UPI00358ECF56
MKIFVVFATCLVVISAATTTKAPDKNTKKPKREPVTLSRGWGDELEWMQTYPEALAKSAETRRPMMVIHHRDDCEYSQKLKEAFSKHQEIQKLADDHFVMLNVVSEITDKNMKPDEMSYVPRIIFVDPSLTVRGDITGPYGNRQYAYEPSDMQLLKENMVKALKLIKTEL